MISLDSGNIIVDTGPDFRQQMLREDVQELNGVLFTHEHKDHVAGLDDIRAFNFKQKEDMDVFAVSRVQEALIREYPYIFSEYKYPGVPQVRLHTIEEDQNFEVLGHTITPIKVWHYKLPVLGFRIKDFTYITDANKIDPEEIEKIKGSKILVINALRQEKHISHFTLEEALEVIQEINPEMAYLTHISHLLGKHEDVEAQLPENVRLAYDSLSVSLR